MSIFQNLSSAKYRWIALVFIALALAIIIIDNTVLNAAIPYYNIYTMHKIGFCY